MPIDFPLNPGLSKRVHMLLHHPTPPAFDGREGRNLLRNHDEIRLFSDYIGCPQCPSTPSTESQIFALRTKKAASTSPSASTKSDTLYSPQQGASEFYSSASVKAVLRGASQLWDWLQGRLGVSVQWRRQLTEPEAYLYDDAGKQGGLAAGEPLMMQGRM